MKTPISNISTTLTQNTPHKTLFINFILNGQLEEVEVVLDNGAGLGLCMWHCMLNSPYRYTATLEQINHNLKEGNIKMVDIERFLTIALQSGKLKIPTLPQPSPTPKHNSLLVQNTPYEEVLEDGLSWEEAKWYYWGEMEKIMREEECELGDYENSQL